jgi:aspartyl-tRNA(Asn)/glutamyl-tRNA(Gln) amidotransferase subunit A
MTTGLKPHQLSAAQAAAAIRSGDLSPVTLVEDLLRRIDELEPMLQAWVTVDREGALATARASEIELEKSGPRGPLHGVPVGLKDIFYTAGIKTTAGSPLYTDFVPEYDATSVAKFRQAGAIVLGKTVTTEFADGDPSPTFNPWNLEHTPGGSSSGSGAAIAAGMVPIATGSQTVGSTLRPAAYNGIVGLKPTLGLISTYGVVPVSFSTDTVGIMVRTVEDAALTLDALAGYDSKNPASVNVPVGQYHAAVYRRQSPPRIGLLKDYFYERADEEVRSHTDAVAQKLAAAGAIVEEVALPEGFAKSVEDIGNVAWAETAAFHQEAYAHHREDYGPVIGSRIERAMGSSPIPYILAQQGRGVLQAAMEPLYAKYDILLSPCTPGPAPKDRTTTGQTFFQAPWTWIACPTIGVPSGLAANGMPLAIQLAAGPFDEERLLGAAAWCERVLDVHLTPMNPNQG